MRLLHPLMACALSCSRPGLPPGAPVKVPYDTGNPAVKAAAAGGPLRLGSAYDAAVPTPDFRTYRQDLSSVPGVPPDTPAPDWRRGFDNQRVADLGDGRFLNPLISGDRPDPGRRHTVAPEQPDLRPLRGESNRGRARARR